MFQFLVNISLKARLLVVVIVAAAMVYGGISLRGLSIDVLPALNKGLVTILTEAPGFAPEEVEVLVTYPIESAMNGASGVTRVRSTSSSEGASSQIGGGKPSRAASHRSDESGTVSMSRTR